MQLALRIDVGTVLVNQVANNPSLWTLPALSGYPQIDLGSAQPGTLPGLGGATNGFTPTSPAASSPIQPVPSSLPTSPAQTPSVYATPSSAIDPIETATPISIEVPPSPAELQPFARQLPPGGIPASPVR